MSKITKPQIKAIHAAKRGVFSSDEDYRGWLSANFNGKMSSLKLTRNEAGEAIKILGMTTGHSKPYTGKGEQNGVRYLSQGQAQKIGALQAVLGWDAERLIGFIKRQTCKLTAVEMLMGWEAKKVIIGLQRVIAMGDKEVYNYLNKLKSGDPATAAGQAIIKAVKMRLDDARKRGMA